MQHFLLASLVISCLAAGQIPDLPDKEGFAGPFAGLSGGALIVAGGANFPEKKPWDGGTKVWYDAIYMLDRADGKWAVAGKLPRPLGYGVCVTWNDNVICVGGSDAGQHYADAFTIRRSDEKLAITPLPPFPQPVANACGAIVGDSLYVAGGIAKPDSTDALATVYMMDLAAKNRRWKEVEPCPGGGRMLATAAALDDALYLVGGASLSAGADGKPVRKYLTDAWRYSPQDGWKPIADLPHAVAAAPSPAPSDAAGFFILGGDDGTQVGVDPLKHKGFNRAVLRFDVKTGKWSEAGQLDLACVTTICVRWKDAWIIPGGEVRPGIRTPKIIQWNPEPH